MVVRETAIRSELLLLRHRRGDPQALTELVALWERPLLYYLRRLLACEEDAWDALQETWIRVMRRLDGVRDGRALPAWLYIVARNAAFTLRRRRAPTEPLPESGEDPAPEALAPEPSLDGFHAMDIHRALERLGLAHREVLTLHFLEGFSVAEIAIITGAPEGTIKSRLHYARSALRALLEGGD